MFGEFGAILSVSDYLTVGQPYTFTFEKLGFLSSFFFFDSDTDIQRGLQERLSGLANIASVSRPFFSDRWIIIMTPVQGFSLDYWVSAFVASLQDMGYTVGFIQAEGGTVSTRPGGAEEIVTETTEQIFVPVAESVSQTAATALKPIFPYILIALGIYAGIMIVPKLIARRG